MRRWCRSQSIANLGRHASAATTRPQRKGLPVGDAFSAKRNSASIRKPARHKLSRMCAQVSGVRGTIAIPKRERLSTCQCAHVSAVASLDQSISQNTNAPPGLSNCESSGSASSCGMPYKTLSAITASKGPNGSASSKVATTVASFSRRRSTSSRSTATTVHPRDASRRVESPMPDPISKTL